VASDAQLFARPLEPERQKTARRERKEATHARLSALPEWCTMAGSPG
jgi:hypothetical protein